MAGLTINGGSQTLDGTYTYDYVTITNGGILYITPYNGTGTTGTLTLNVTGDVIVDATSSINGNARGYTGGGGGSGGVIGQRGWGGSGAGGGGAGGQYYDTGMGGGGGGGASYGSGSGGGGRGGGTYGGGGGGAGSTYGTSSGWDIAMGSGAGGGGGSCCHYQWNGAGGSPGGASLTINAGNINIYGTLNFNGGNGGNGGYDPQNPQGGGGGGGASGGGILLNGNNINLNGATITTVGGGGGSGTGGGATSGGSGGGGRFKVFGTTIIITGATITAGTAYYEIVTGSALLTSSPSGASIYIDNSPTSSGTTPNTISGLSPGTHTYKLVSGIYTATGTFTVTTGMTTNVSVTINVTAIDIVSNTNTCVDTCQVTITTTWKNNGNTDITFRPAIKIDTVLVQSAADITIAAGSNSNPIEIVTPTLSIGMYQICPYPN